MISGSTRAFSVERVSQFFFNAFQGGHMSVQKWVIVASLVFLVVALLPVPSAAQMQTSGEVIGTVTDPSGAAVPGATVTLVDAGTGQSRQATTDSSGSFVFLSVVPGTYDLSIQAKGFAGAIAKRNDRDRRSVDFSAFPAHTVWRDPGSNRQRCYPPGPNDNLGRWGSIGPKGDRVAATEES